MNCQYLKFDDRKNLSKMYNQGVGLCVIARNLGVHLATIYRELARGNTGKLDKHGRDGYNADLAQATITKSLKRRGRKASNNNETE